MCCGCLWQCFLKNQVFVFVTRQETSAVGHPSLAKQFVGSAAFPWWHFPAMVTKPVPSTTPPANCRQDSPIHPIQLSEPCISGVSIFLTHHHLCVHTENRSSLAAHSSSVFLPHIATTSCFLLSVAKTFSFAFSG